MRGTLHDYLQRGDGVTPGQDCINSCEMVGAFANDNCGPEGDTFIACLEANNCQPEGTACQNETIAFGTCIAGL